MMSGYDVCDGDSCKRFISSGMTGRSCSQYCSSVGLHCTGAWEERDNSCAVEEEWTCDQTTKRDGGTTSDLICRCASSEPPPPKRLRSASPCRTGPRCPIARRAFPSFFPLFLPLLFLSPSPFLLGGGSTVFFKVSGKMLKINRILASRNLLKNNC